MKKDQIIENWPLKMGDQDNKNYQLAQSRITESNKLLMDSDINNMAKKNRPKVGFYYLSRTQIK